MRKLVVLAYIAIIAVSCGKDFLEQDSGTSLPGEPVLTQIKQGSAVRTKFDYNNKGQLVKITHYSPSGGVAADEVRRYNDDGLVTKIETSVDISSSSAVPNYVLSYAELVYDAGNKKLVEIKNYNIQSGAAQYVSRSVPDVDAQGRTTAVTIYSMPANTAASKTTYEYNADNNVVKTQFFQFSTGTSATMTKEFEYDSKKNPLQGKWVMPYGVNYSNIVKEISTNHIIAPGISNTPVTTLITFKSYNSFGCPTLVTENGLDYTYEYQ